MEFANEKQQSCAADGADLKSCYMQKFRLYETRSKFYMIGRDKNRSFWRVLKIDRLEPSELNITEDSTMYTEIECCDLLRRIHEGNKSTGGLKFVTTCYGIIGFIKFLEPYYMLLITKRRKIGTICGHTIYAITKSEMFPVPHATVRSKMAFSKDENRSLVHSACKCSMSMVHIRRHMRVPCPMYLDENYVITNGYLFKFIGGNILFELHILLVSYFYIIEVFLVLYMLIVSLQCIHTMWASSVQLLLVLSLFLLTSSRCLSRVTCIVIPPSICCFHVLYSIASFFSCKCTGAIFIAVVMLM